MFSTYIRLQKVANVGADSEPLPAVELVIKLLKALVECLTCATFSRWKDFEQLLLFDVFLLIDWLLIHIISFRIYNITWIFHSHFISESSLNQSILDLLSAAIGKLSRFKFWMQSESLT